MLVYRNSKLSTTCTQYKLADTIKCAVLQAYPPEGETFPVFEERSEEPLGVLFGKSSDNPSSNLECASSF